VIALIGVFDGLCLSLASFVGLGHNSSSECNVMHWVVSHNPDISCLILHVVLYGVVVNVMGYSDCTALLDSL